MDVRAALRDLQRAVRVLARQDHHRDHLVQRTDARPRRPERPRCGARCRDGHPCTARVVWRPGDLQPRKRCRLHGGLSTGPRTVEGLRRSLANLRGIHPEASPALRQACGVEGFGSERCGACAARFRVNAPALERAAREPRAVAPAELLCAACAAKAKRAQERGRLRFTARW